jgi:glycosyltransferase involved in cell wall biosynthesis
LSGAGKTIQVMHVVPGLGPGGMELAMVRVISGLTGADMRHTVVGLKGDPHVADRLPPETDVRCLRARPNEPQLPARIGWLVRRLRPTVIHARNWGAWPDTALGRLLCLPRPPLIFSFHGLGRAGYMPLRRRMASTMLVNLTNRLFTVSEQTREMLIAHWGWPAGRTEVIHNGVDTERFRPLRGASPGRRRLAVGTVGNLRAVKNHALLVRAGVELCRRGVDLEIRIAGGGDERPRLLGLAARERFTDRLTLAGRVEDVPAFLNDLDVFVLPSDSEQHPNALNEAMACGVASVATRVGCVEEMLDGGRCGRIVEPGDQPALVAALGELLADEGLRRDLGLAGREHVRRHFSMERMLADYEALYRSTAAGGGARP